MNHRCANKPPIDEISVLTPFPGECGGGGLELPSSLWKESEEHLPAGHTDLFMPLYQVLGKYIHIHPIGVLSVQMPRKRDILLGRPHAGLASVLDCGRGAC